MNTLRRLGCLAIALAVVAGTGCGKNRVTLDVDVLSFMDPAETERDYTAASLVPLTTRIEPIAVQLLEGYDDLGVAEEATLDTRVEYDNQTGTGSARVTIYFGPDAATVYTTAPATVLDVNLQPSEVTNGSVTIQADERLLGLFTSRTFYMGMDLEWLPSSAEPLAGTSRLTRIQARVVSRLDLL